LEVNGVKQINPMEEKFDVNFHIATESIKVEDKEKDGIILDVLQKGYTLNGKVIREARVKVGEVEN
jgi:molecular chaperone GrpE